MREIFKYGQHLAGEVDPVHIQIIRRVAVDQGVYDRLQESGLAGHYLSDDRMVPACIEADPERFLYLIGGVIDQTDHCIQLPFVCCGNGPAAVVEGFLPVTRDLIQADRSLQGRQPQTVDRSVTLFLCDAGQIFLDRTELGLFFLLAVRGRVTPAA